MARVSSGTLDGYRGMLAIIVCFAHSWQILINPQFGPYHWDHAILGLAARCAVVAFYVLSGWVICQSVNINIQKNGEFIPSDWALNRFFRIAIPLLASISLTTFLWVLIRVTHIDGAATPFGLARIEFSYRLREVLLGMFTLGFKGDLTGGMNGALWSLAIEIQLYVLTLLFFWFRKIGLFWAGLIICVGLIRIPTDPNIFLGYGAFSLGFMLSKLSFKDKYWLEIVKYVGAFVGLGALIFMLYSFHKSPNYLDHLADWGPAATQLWLASGCALFLLGAPNFEVPCISKTGGFSYTLYIFHFPILLLFSYLLYRYANVMSNFYLAWMIWFLGGSVVVVISSFVGDWLERPKQQKAWVLAKYELPHKG